eukprot:TCONS_00000828-protein
MSGSKELELVERVFFRLVLAESDDKFQSELNGFLPPVLLKIATTDEKVKNKVLELLTHVNKRLKSRPTIELPLGTLLVQYTDAGVPSSVKNFTFIYIKMGYQRCSLEEKLKLMPKMFKSIIGKNPAHQSKLLGSILFDMNSLVYPENQAEKKKLFPFLEDQATRVFVLEYFLDFLLLPYDMNLDMKDQTVLPPPSFSRASFQRTQTDPIMNRDQIETAKLAILKFLSSELIDAEDVIPHFIISSSDTKHTVAGKGENGIKTYSSANTWENKKLLNKILLLYQGTVHKPGNMATYVAADNVRLPSSPRLKMKIFPFLLKSRIIADVNPALCLQIIFEGQFGDKTNQKLKQYCLEFIHHISLTASSKTLSFLAPLFNQALSRVSFNRNEDAKLRILALNGFSKIAKSAPEVIKRDVTIVEKLFSLLIEESSEIQSAVLSIISSITKTFETAQRKDQNVLESLLLRYCTSESSQVRIGACRLAQSAFSSVHLPSRFALIILSVDSQEQLKEESSRALFPTSGTYPVYEDVCYYMFDQFSTSTQNSLAIRQVLLFLKKCLYQSCDIKEDDLEDTISTKITAYLNQKVQSIENDNLGKSFIGKHITLLKNALVYSLDYTTYTLALENLFLLFTSNESLTLLFQVEDQTIISKLFSSPNDDVRRLAAQVLSILFARHRPLQSGPIQNLLDELSSPNQHELYKDGKIYCIGYTLPRYFELLQCGHAEINLDLNSLVALTKEILQVLCTIVKQKNQQNFIMASCCTSLYNICRYVELPVSDASTKAVYADEMVTLLSELFKSTNHVKTKETFALALTSLCVGDTDFVLKEKVVELLFKSAKIKEVELQFAIGECISCIGAGQSSKVFKRYYHHEMTLKVPEDEVMLGLLKRIISEVVHSPLALARQAGVIWLLSLVQYTSDHPVVSQEIKQIQKAFMTCLCDADEVTQDVASRGLSLIYESTSDENKQEMMEYLTDSLMQGNRPKQQKIDADTKLFEEGALGSSPDGSKLSTYKELCSLATSMNKPDLIYKFMSLANHNAVWNSKKGAAFGIKAIAEIAGEEIKPLIGLIIPKLYRYQYDPNSSLKRSMTSIWSVLVKDEKNMIATHWRSILEDLMSNITHNLWRTREACCSALKDLLKEIPDNEIVPHLVDIWNIAFKLMDDVKETVRKAATALVIALSNLSVRFCETQNSEVGEQALEKILDVLLNVGITSRVDEVKAISLKTLVKITKTGGKLLDKYVTTIIPTMLEALSGLEPQAFNTLRMQLSNDGDVQEKLDVLRVSSTNSSPMMEAINLSLMNVNETNLGDLAPKLCLLLKSGMGIATKVGTATVISSLVLLCQEHMKPYAGKFLSSLLNGVKNSNASVIKKAYSSCIGAVMKHAQESTVEKVIAKIKGWFFESEDNKNEEACSLCIGAMIKSSSELFTSYGSLLVPLVLVAMQQEESSKGDVKKPWTEIWAELPSGTKASMKLYLSEIYELAKECYQSKLWVIRKNATKAINMVVLSIGGTMQASHVINFLKLTLENLSGRTWDGKETLLDTTMNLCVKCKESIKSQDDLIIMEKV